MNKSFLNQIRYLSHASYTMGQTCGLKVFAVSCNALVALSVLLLAAPQHYVAPDGAQSLRRHGACSAFAFAAASHAWQKTDSDSDGEHETQVREQHSGAPAGEPEPQHRTFFEHCRLITVEEAALLSGVSTSDSDGCPLVLEKFGCYGSRHFSVHFAPEATVANENVFRGKTAFGQRSEAPRTFDTPVSPRTPVLPPRREGLNE